MMECGYDFNELLFISRNQQTAINIAMNCFDGVCEVLENSSLRKSDITALVEKIKNEMLRIERTLKQNPLPRSTRKRHLARDLRKQAMGEK